MIQSFQLLLFSRFMYKVAFIQTKSKQKTLKSKAKHKTFIYIQLKIFVLVTAADSNLSKLENSRGQKNNIKTLNRLDNIVSKDILKIFTEKK